MRMTVFARALVFLGISLGALPLLAGCSGDTATTVVPDNAVTRQKTADMQKAMLSNAKGPTGHSKASSK